MNIYSTYRKKSTRLRYKLKELNLKLLRIFFFSKILTKFALFYGNFLRNILYILTNIYKYTFKFCFITNNSINARFIARYIGLKLKRKFPLFSVINPLKRELKKLSYKKREKKKNLFSKLFNYTKNNINKKMDYKSSFKNVLLYLNNKYIEFCIINYNYDLTFITFDIFMNYILIKNKYNEKTKILQLYLKKKFIETIKESK
jgi:hypothetical protein